MFVPAKTLTDAVVRAARETRLWGASPERQAKQFMEMARIYKANSLGTPEPLWMRHYVLMARGYNRVARYLSTGYGA